MKIFFRVFSFAKPLGKYLPLYLITTLISVVFGAINLVLLAPLVNILFATPDAAFIAENSQLPSFEMSVAYFERLFNYHMLQMLEAQGKVYALYFVLAVIIVSVIIANVFTYLSAVILAKIRANVIRKIRTTVFDNVSRLHLGFFSNERKGDIMSRITNDVQEVENTVVNAMKVLFKEPFQILAYLVAMLVISPGLTLFAILYIAVTGYIISEITKRLKKKSIESQESLSRLVSILDETLGGMRIIKAFTAVNYINNKFEQEVKQYARINVSMAYKNELGSPISQILGVAAVSGIMIYGGIRVFEGVLDAGQFIAFIAIFSQLLNPAKAISKEVSMIQRGLASAERIFSLMDVKSSIVDAPGAKSVLEFKDRISFKNVNFSYVKEPVLKNINLEIEKGRTIALVGLSGGGKSTMADLVPRFYDPTSGVVEIDGASLTEVKIESLRKLMGIVSQESILFNDTIFNNIAFGVADARHEDVERAAKIANAHDFIMQTESGYLTSIGDRGSKLSGGQRQRLSIARAVFKNPPILILDEATSALDSESEKLVQDALTNLMKNRTSIVIAHRLSTIQHADEIIVLQHGEIIERGVHNELIQLNGVYSKLISMQSV